MDHYNANNMLVYCKAFIGEGKAKNAIAASYCNGMIDMLAIMSSWLDKYPDVCIEFPKDVTTQQAVRVIVRYIEAHLERMRDSFHLLAIEALHNAWPCGTSSDSNNRFYAK